MTASFSITADTDLVRIAVQITGADADTLTVFRVHEDGTQYPVRGLEGVATSGGAAFAYDYEAPLAEDVEYTVDDDGTVVTSSATRLPTADVWLRAPGLPSLDVGEVEAVGKPTAATRPRPVVALVPLGGSRPVAVYGARQDATGWRLLVRTRTHVKARALQLLVEQSGVLLVMLPGTRHPWRYVIVEDVVESEVTSWRLPDFDPAVGNPGTSSSVSQWATWELACTVVDRPAGGLQGDPTSSWQAIKDAFATWEDVDDAYDDWLGVKRGVADPDA